VGRQYDIITFDCYGTLIDWENGIGDAFLELARRQGWETTRRAILTAYHQVEPVVEGEGYRTYREVLAETARRVARTFGHDLPAAQSGALAQSLPRWRPFPDTNSALERLRNAGHRLGILSNIDDDLLAETRKHFSVDFDLIITAQQVKSYKPELNHFVTARERIGQGRWLHAAQSYFHDIVPAFALGIPSAWVNRKGDLPTQEARPNFEVATLGELAATLCA
jgi:2-haloalkanoic acid dehalogenase type II